MPVTPGTTLGSTRFEREVKLLVALNDPNSIS